MSTGFSVAQAARRSFGRFMRDEDGSMILFGLYLFMGILLIGGISVDIMRNEFSRLKLQNTVDTAILAAADLDQRLDPEAVVIDYFEKAGLLHLLDDVSVTENVNSRTVSARSSMDVDTLFIDALGVDILRARASGTAREDISDIEVSMVLDVSGSMGYQNRLRNLKVAASNFVQMLLSDARVAAADDEVSISIVPYSTQVAPGPTILSQMRLNQTHDYSHCVDFEADDYGQTSIPLAERNQTGHFDPWSRTSPPRDLVCRTDPDFHVRPISQDRDALLAHIDALTPDGNTSSEIGVKWGTALLDPDSRATATAALIANGEVPPVFADRPFDYNRPNSMKVLVVMTDGKNTTQYTLDDAYGGGMSDVWGRQLGNGTWRFSVHEPAARPGSNDDWFHARNGRWRPTADGGATARQLTYHELWAAASIDYNAYRMWYRQDYSIQAYNSWRYGPFNSVPATVKDQRLTDICRAARDQGILVFTVAFEIDSTDARLMRQCASSDNHYFEASGDELIYAFSAIASSINQLRLVQ